MKDLIEALSIFLKYGNPQYPTDHSRDQLLIHPLIQKVSPEDSNRLEELGFSYDSYKECWGSYRFGSG